MYPFCPLRNCLMHSKFTSLSPALWSWVWGSANYICLLCSLPTPCEVPQCSGRRGAPEGDWRQEEERTCYLLTIQAHANPVKGFLPDSSNCPQVPRTSHFAPPWGHQLQPDGTLSPRFEFLLLRPFSEPPRHQHLQDGACPLSVWCLRTWPLSCAVPALGGHLCATPVCPVCFFHPPKGV